MELVEKNIFFVDFSVKEVIIGKFLKICYFLGEGKIWKF